MTTAPDLSQFAYLFAWCGWYHELLRVERIHDILLRACRSTAPCDETRWVELHIAHRRSDFAQMAVQHIACALLHKQAGEVAPCG